MKFEENETKKKVQGGGGEYGKGRTPAKTQEQDGI
jgi:hypothetical protein